MTRECMRVLKPTGSIWVNLGDKYAQDTERSRHGQGGGLKDSMRYRARIERYADGGRNGVPTKSLIGLPWRYAIRCIDELGLILRAEVIWSKPNGLPESVTDRVRRSHETWFHLVRSPRYFSAVDAIREPASDFARPRNATRTTPPPPGNRPRAMTGSCNPLGRLPGSVWEIATEPLTVPDHLGIDHYAAFPVEWPRRIILGWSPSGICIACGESRLPTVVRGPRVDRRPSKHSEYPTHQGGHETRTLDVVPDYRITGEVCACEDTSASTRPAVVLDPFGGTGTTAMVAEALGRRGVSVDMSADYLRIAKWRTSDPGQRAKALGVPRPPAETDGQLDLLAGVTP